MTVAGLNGVVTLTGAAISGSDNDEQGLTVNADGTIQKQENGVVTQLSALTDWIIPISAASGDYDVRITNVVFTQGTVFSTAAAVEDTWIDLSADRSWFVQDADPAGTGVVDVAFDLEIRRGSNTLASTAYTIDADFEP